jgi:hypothetical protein
VLTLAPWVVANIRITVVAIAPNKKPKPELKITALI